MVVIRLCKIALVAASALFFSLVAYGNIADYGSNWLFVQHVLSMDTTFPNSSLHWRAITNPSMQEAGYWLIIAAEMIAAALLWLGAARLLTVAATPAFKGAKGIAVAGLTIGLLLYIVGFIIAGGEWFAMWQSAVWNGQQKAFDFIAMIGLVLVVLLLPDGDHAE